MELVKWIAQPEFGEKCGRWWVNWVWDFELCTASPEAWDGKPRATRDGRIA